MDETFREEVLARDRHTCQARARGFAPHVPCRGRLHIHHIVLGTKVDTMENVLAVCDAHHRHLHDVDRAGAEQFGLIIRRGNPGRTDIRPTPSGGLD
jgi:hypothetical protein